VVGRVYVGEDRQRPFGRVASVSEGIRTETPHGRSRWSERRRTRAEKFAAALAAVLDSERELAGEPVAWLMTIARNKLTDSLRRGQVERVARGRLALEPLSLDDEDLRRIDELVDATDVAVELARVIVLAGVEPERWVLARHQRGVGDDSQHPAVQPEDEVEDRSGIAAANQQYYCRDEHEQADQSNPASSDPEAE
jgi:DNA-directed RNA polymerase specialized sigma24 family protein